MIMLSEWKLYIKGHIFYVGFTYMKNLELVKFIGAEIKLMEGRGNWENTEFLPG